MFKFGDLTITLSEIPGHTPGSLAFIFPVKDKGQTRMAGLFGGTVLTTGILTTDALKQYIQSIAHYLDAAKKMNVDVELQNHPIFDGMPDKLAKLKSAKASDPNPFVIGNDRTSRCGPSFPNVFRLKSRAVRARIERLTPDQARILNRRFLPAQFI